nr:hypothetical protein [Streptomyces acidiscabies]
MGLAVFEVLALGAVSCEVSPVRGGELWVGLGFWLVAACYYSEEAVGQGSAAIAAMRLLASITATTMIGAVVRFVPCVGAGSLRERSCPASWCKRSCSTRSGKPRVGHPMGHGLPVARRLTCRQPHARPRTTLTWR